MFPFLDSKEARRADKAKEDILLASSAHDSSYFDIPTKEGHMANNGIHEIPTKDTEGDAAHTTTGGEPGWFNSVFCAKIEKNVLFVF